MLYELHELISIFPYFGLWNQLSDVQTNMFSVFLILSCYLVGGFDVGLTNLKCSGLHFVIKTKLIGRGRNLGNVDPDRDILFRFLVSQNQESYPWLHFIDNVEAWSDFDKLWSNSVNMTEISWVGFLNLNSWYLRKILIFEI